MFDFSSIATHVQVKIAEKMIYEDQKEFELSSQHGKQIVDLQKTTPGAEFREMNVYNNDVHFTCWPRYGSVRWSKLRGCWMLPRLKVPVVKIFGSQSVTVIKELCSRVDFVQNGVCMIWENSDDPTQILTQILKMFHIAEFVFRYPPNSGFLSEPLLSMIDSVEVNIVGIDYSYDVFLQIRSRTMKLNHSTAQVGMDSLANLFFQQWFQKKRNIDWFFLTSPGNQNSKYSKSALNFNIPFLVIWEAQEYETKKDIRLKQMKFPFLFTSDFIWSVDRGDKKLLVFFSEKYSFIAALEFTNLDDVVEITNEDE